MKKIKFTLIGLRSAVPDIVMVPLVWERAKARVIRLFTLIELLACQGVVQRAKRLMRFTLIELLVVIAIISVLMTMLLPALKKARDFSRQTVCQGNLKQISQAGIMYVNDYDGWFPLYSLDAPPDMYYFRDLINSYLNIATNVDLNYLMGHRNEYPEWYRGTWKNSIWFCPSCTKEDDWSDPNTPCYGTYGPNTNLMAFRDIAGSSGWYANIPAKKISNQAAVGIPSKRIMFCDNYKGNWWPYCYFWLKPGKETNLKFRHGVNSEYIDKTGYSLAGNGKAVMSFVDGHVESLHANEVKFTGWLNPDNWQKAD